MKYDMKEEKKQRIPKPSWLKVKAPSGKKYLSIKNLLDKLNLATVCQEAQCPNIGECWTGGTATFMLMGDVCTRGCRFCAVKTSKKGMELDKKEPEKVGFAISQMGLDYVVLTSVDRDDLEDQGASHFARTVEVIKNYAPKLIVEILTPDFRGDQNLIDKVASSSPDVFAHNVETVKRLTPMVRDRRATYEQSLNLLEYVKKHYKIYTKTSLMLGLGEKESEVKKTLYDLRQRGCDVVTFGQYLQPTKRHLKINEYIHPDKFKNWQKEAESMGFLYVASGPLVRSSYKAGEYFLKGIIEKTKDNKGVELCQK